MPIPNQTRDETDGNTITERSTKQDPASPVKPENVKPNQESKEKMPWYNDMENIWKALSVISIFWSFCVTYTLKGFNDWAQENLTSYAQFSDFQYSLYFAIFLFITRRSFEFFIYKPVKANLLPQYQGADREARAQKVVKWIYSILYYGATTIFVYYNYGSTRVMDPIVFGSGNKDEML